MAEEAASATSAAGAGADGGRILEDPPQTGDLDEYLRYLDRFQEQAQILSLRSMQQRQQQESTHLQEGGSPTELKQHQQPHDL